MRRGCQSEKKPGLLASSLASSQPRNQQHPVGSDGSTQVGLGSHPSTAEQSLCDLGQVLSTSQSEAPHLIHAVNEDA